MKPALAALCLACCRMPVARAQTVGLSGKLGGKPVIDICVNRANDPMVLEKRHCR